MEVPIKINIHAWKVRLDCLPTRLNLSSRGLDIPSILCPSYGVIVETTSHVFFQCELAKDLFSEWFATGETLPLERCTRLTIGFCGLTAFDYPRNLKIFFKGFVMSCRLFIGLDIDVKGRLVGLSG
ncbi:RNA-directed DNA polymerase, eukaryota [Tanacetum coccineum]